MYGIHGFHFWWSFSQHGDPWHPGPGTYGLVLVSLVISRGEDRTIDNLSSPKLGSWRRNVRWVLKVIQKYKLEEINHLITIVLYSSIYHEWYPSNGIAKVWGPHLVGLRVQVHDVNIFGMELFDDQIRDWALAQRWLWHKHRISCSIETGDLAQEPIPYAHWVIGIHPEVGLRGACCGAKQVAGCDEKWFLRRTGLFTATCGFGACHMKNQKLHRRRLQTFLADQVCFCCWQSK